MRQVLGPKCKISRRIGKNIPVKGAKLLLSSNPFNKRPFPPGPRGKRPPSRLSEFGIQIKEKQAVKNTYALSDSQLHKYYRIANQRSGEKSKFDIFYSMLESRLDNVIYRSGLASTRQQARQWVTHEHFLLNGKKVKTPSLQLNVGDKVSLKPVSNKIKEIAELNLKQHVSGVIPNHLRVDQKNMSVDFIDTINAENPDPDLNFIATLEFYSKK